MSRSQIFVADFLRALVELKIDSPEVARGVMRMLSLDSWADIALTTAGPGREEAPVPISLPSRPPPAPEAPSPAPKLEGGGSSETVVREPTLARALKNTSASSATTPAWTRTPPIWSEKNPALKRATSYASPTPDALFDPLQMRTILTSLAAARLDDDALDIDALIGVLARAEPVVALPRGRGWGVRRGLEVLIDRGASMAPFVQDIEQLVAQLGALVPPDRVRRAKFAGSPARGVKVPRRPQAPWRPPERGTALLVISDLGLCSGEESFDAASAGEWLDFASAARRAGVKLRTLVPYPPARWPAALCGPLGCIHWDHRTTAGAVRRALVGVER